MFIYFTSNSSFRILLIGGAMFRLLKKFSLSGYFLIFILSLCLSCSAPYTIEKRPTVKNACSDNKIRYFRFSWENLKGDPEYRSEVCSESKVTGGYYKSTSDENGREIKRHYFINDTKLSSITFNYDSTSKYYTGYDFYKNDKLMSVVQLTRKDDGTRAKKQVFTNENQLTSYTLYTRNKNVLEAIDYSPDGLVKNFYKSKYNRYGEIISYKWHPGNKSGKWYEQNIYYEYFINENGTTSHYHKYNKLRRSIKCEYIYNDVGQLIERVLYNTYKHNSPLLAKHRLKNGLLVEKESWDIIAPRYKTHELIKIKYDDNSNAKSADVYWDEKLRIKLKFERYPNGTIKRTVAYNTSGEIISEFPNRVVLHLNLDGSTIDGVKGKVYKKP